MYNLVLVKIEDEIGLLLTSSGEIAGFETYEAAKNYKVRCNNGQSGYSMMVTEALHNAAVQYKGIKCESLETIEEDWLNGNKDYVLRNGTRGLLNKPPILVLDQGKAKILWERKDD